MLKSYNLGGIFFPVLICAMLINVAATAAVEKNYDIHDPLSHISPVLTLYRSIDTGWLKAPENRVSRYVRREKNSDLVIALPDAGMADYRIRFADAENRLLFELRNIRDTVLIVEKYNFQHAGTFRYELFRENTMIEKNTFVIKKDQ